MAKKELVLKIDSKLYYNFMQYLETNHITAEDELIPHITNCSWNNEEIIRFPDALDVDGFEYKQGMRTSSFAMYEIMFAAKYGIPHLLKLDNDEKIYLRTTKEEWIYFGDWIRGKVEKNGDEWKRIFNEHK